MISVIIPLYNAAKTIEDSLNSIKNQTWTGEFEIIVVNDGSTDESKIIVEKFISEHPNLSVLLINQKNNGVSAARNLALNRANGEFIAFLDADDVWLPKKTELQMQILTKKNIEVDFISCRRSNQILRWPYISKTSANNLISVDFRKLMLRNEIQPSTVIFKRKILENTGFFRENQRYAEDLNYWLRISQKNKMFILNVPMVVIDGGKRSFGVSGLSANLPEMEKGFQKNLREIYYSKKINFLEYLTYFIFYKAKYVVRISRNQILKVFGR